MGAKRIDYPSDGNYLSTLLLLLKSEKEHNISKYGIEMAFTDFHTYHCIIYNKHQFENVNIKYHSHM